MSVGDRQRAGKEAGTPPRARATRKPRADAQRNRDQLLAAAKAAFAEVGPDVTLEEIARRAEVGIATLYRNFPTREAIVEAVYRREVQQLAEAAPRLLQSRPPAEALKAWMLMFIDYVATKRLIAPALSAVANGSPDFYASSSALIREAIGHMVERAKAEGAIREDADSGDLLGALIGFASVRSSPDWQASARRLIDILMDGLRGGRSAG